MNYLQKLFFLNLLNKKFSTQHPKHVIVFSSQFTRTIFSSLFESVVEHCTLGTQYFLTFQPQTSFVMIGRKGRQMDWTHVFIYINIRINIYVCIAFILIITVYII